MNCRLCHKELVLDPALQESIFQDYYCCRVETNDQLSQYSQYYARMIDGTVTLESIVLDMRYELTLDYEEPQSVAIYSLDVHHDYIHARSLITIDSIPRFDLNDIPATIKKIKLYLALS